jgi:hypothetical protein
VVITFLLIGVCARYFFPYGWTWPQCLLFGAMLSATDPVAVVAVLHEVGRCSSDCCQVNHSPNTYLVCAVLCPAPCAVLCAVLCCAG